ncbi:hypothetical protein acsn021_04120 [Anaerocolumna cellulosilytica]|uniref:Uncharacterized protein n=1 Tax=Anaerocolumna cellulosilytica TaxID=433286 RepID=A0A6S6QNB2_9FIRM|nr:hypothetical protein [Anaerocolumna cellulosilytica]MBB5197400.1 hypothetical protein [Anaerocolumna cellulosilytica]BCJ92843.1 hypothetical protein acsn021_04120 [Anaerocolumna cellulosilytica]
MVYIPDEWFNNPQNKDAVFELLGNNTDVIHENQSEVKIQILTRLKDLGETIILEHYEKNEIAFDS